MRAIILLATAASLVGFQVQAFCIEPSFSKTTPSAPYGKPNKPFCLSGYNITGEHTCSEWEIQSFLSEVDRYVRALQSYHEETVTFANEAARYSNEALEYAKCEAQEATE